MKTYFTEANGIRTEYKFVPSHTLPTNIPISTPLTFAFIGKNLVLTRKNNGWWDVLGGKLQKGETWKEALKREALEEAGIIIDYISVVGYIVASNSGNLTNLKFAPRNILPVTISFVQEVQKTWLRYETLGREHFRTKWAKKALLNRHDNNQLAEIFDYVLLYYNNQKYDYTFDYVEGDTPLVNIPNTQAMVFVKTPDKKFLIVRDFDEKFFSLPGGGCGIDEDGKECAIREVKEEAHVEVHDIKLIGNIIVKVSKHGQILSVSTQQRYLANVLNVPRFIVPSDKFNEEYNETVERREVSFEVLGKEVKSLRNKTGRTILSSLKPIL